MDAVGWAEGGLGQPKGCGQDEALRVGGEPKCSFGVQWREEGAVDPGFVPAHVW